VKNAAAIKIAFETGMTSFPIEFARLGLDYETEMERQAKSLGITLAEYQAALRGKLFPALAQQTAGVRDE
jgi:hypothetical protein